MKWVIAIIVMLGLSVGVFLILRANSQPVLSPVASPSATSTGVSKTTNTFTLTEVSAHKTSQSCWAVISGKVYDLTKWISQHPGGAAAIAGICGTDATSTFVKQHAAEAKPETTLTSFLIGELKN